MRKARTPITVVIAVLALGTLALAASGIEVLSIVPDGPSCWVESATSEAPLGSIMEAVTIVNGVPHVVDVAPIDPANGISWVNFPDSTTENWLVARDPSGEILATTQPGDGGYGGILEFD